MSNCTSPGTKRINANVYPSINLPSMFNWHLITFIYVVLNDYNIYWLLILVLSVKYLKLYIYIIVVESDQNIFTVPDSSVMSGIFESSIGTSLVIGVRMVLPRLLRRVCGASLFFVFYFIVIKRVLKTFSLTEMTFPFSSDSRSRDNPTISPRRHHVTTRQANQ